VRAKFDIGVSADNRGDTMTFAHVGWRRTALAGTATTLMLAVVAASPSGAIVVSGGDGEAPEVTAGGTYTVDEGSSVVLSGVDVYDPDGDYFDLSWSPGGQLDDPSSLSPTFTPTSSGTQTLTLTATDDTGLEGSDTVVVVVNNVAPSIDGPVEVGVDPVPVGTTVSVSATASDPGTSDTHTWTVDWGDGTTSEGTGLVVDANHEYSGSGVYTVSVTVTDSDGASVTTEADNPVVVYDPSGGFVTGGGWIDSPVGAFTPNDASDEDFVGKATFGFVAKYKKGTTIPTGNIEFQLHANGTNMHSTSLSWLIVSDGNKAIFTGQARVNGVDGYRFQVTVGDIKQGGSDTFRLKVVEDATGSVLYDSQPGDSLFADATTPLSQGNIVVHK
jgi:PKD repeat protein